MFMTYYSLIMCEKIKKYNSEEMQSKSINIVNLYDWCLVEALIIFFSHSHHFSNL